MVKGVLCVARVIAFVTAFVLVGGMHGPAAFAASVTPVEQLVSAKGELPRSGRVVIRSGLAWMSEDDPLFTSVARVLGEAFIRRGLVVVAAAPSDDAPFPAGTETVRNAAIPKHQGAPARPMSIAEAVARMRAMQLAREGRLPQAKFKGAKSVPSSGQPHLTRQEMIRFALSQEEGEPELRGHVTIPGRVPEEVRASDHAVADYAVVVRFAMLWPGSGIPDEPPQINTRSGLAVGWHLLELACYDLTPARNGKGLKRVWNATVQRVAFGAYLRGTLPRMAIEAVEPQTGK
ncbi:MAG: hypothetical protein DELT_01152 [Desulfovibrio sp.]